MYSYENASKQNDMKYIDVKFVIKQPNIMKKWIKAFKCISCENAFSQNDMKHLDVKFVIPNLNLQYLW